MADTGVRGFWDYAVTLLRGYRIDTDKPPLTPIHLKNDGVAVAIHIGYPRRNGTRKRVVTFELEPLPPFEGESLAGGQLVLSNGKKEPYTRKLPRGGQGSFRVRPGKYTIDLHPPSGE